MSDDAIITTLRQRELLKIISYTLIIKSRIKTTYNWGAYIFLG